MNDRLALVLTVIAFHAVFGFCIVMASRPNATRWKITAYIVGVSPISVYASIHQDPLLTVAGASLLLALTWALIYFVSKQ